MKTPQMPSEALTKALTSSAEVWLKREDKHHYGSHKGRSIPLMINTHHKEGYKTFVISSSGNAALAAIHTVQTHNKNKPNDPLTLHIFIGENIDKNKKNLLQEKINQDNSILLTQDEAPKQAAIQFEKENKAKLLRQSTDDVSLIGYAELAKELAKIENLAAVFVPTSSGTTAEGLHLGFKQLGLNPQIHIIQTTACHPIASQTGADAPPDETASLAGAIVDKVAHRKDAVAAAVAYSHGAGWIASNNDIEQAQQTARETLGFDISPNSALSIVGLQKAIKGGYIWNGAVACLITGH